MKERKAVWSTCLVVVLCASGAALFGQSSGPARNPGVFQKYTAPVSSALAFAASDQGQQVLLHSPNPQAQHLLLRFFGSAASSQWPAQPQFKPSAGTRILPATAVSGCGTASGTEFNREPALNAVPQNEPPVDFIPNRISGAASTDLVMQSANDFRFFTSVSGNPFSNSLTGVYVHRDGTVACYGGTDFELGSPPIADPLHAGQVLGGFGDPRVIADHTNDQFILTDLRENSVASAIGLRRIPAANLASTAKCPAGTESLAAAATCAGSFAVALGTSEEDNEDFDNSAQDQRTGTATGAGNIYVTWTRLDNDFTPTTEIDLVACKGTFASLADCSAPLIVSGSDTDVQFSTVAIVPGGANAGKITIAYMNYSLGTTQIKMAVCTPKGAPLAPACAAPTVVRTEPNPIASFLISTFTLGGLTDNTFRIQTIPHLADRADAAGQTTFLVWDNCHVPSFAPLAGAFASPCPDADVVMATSTNLGTSWSFSAVDNGVGTHEFFPAISVDPGQNITNIAYYKASDAFHYKNRTQVYLKQIPSGSTIPGAALVVTTSPDSPNGDPNLPNFAPQYGDYIGVSARSSASTAGTGRAYIGHTNDSRLGSYGLAPPLAMNPESNNHVSKVTY